MNATSGMVPSGDFDFTRLTKSSGKNSRSNEVSFGKIRRKGCCNGPRSNYPFEPKSTRRLASLNRRHVQARVHGGTLHPKVGARGDEQDHERSYASGQCTTGRSHIQPSSARDRLVNPILAADAATGRFPPPETLGDRLWSARSDFTSTQRPSTRTTGRLISTPFCSPLMRNP